QLIEEPGPLLSLAELHFQRANSRRALRLTEAGIDGSIVADLQAAVEHARRNGELEFLADAAALLARTANGDDPTCTSNHIVQQLDEVLQLPVPPDRRATLLQAKAHLLRSSNPGMAAALLAEAVALLPRDDPFRWEIGAERVIFL